MKKLFTLVAVALMAVGASAQQTVWNFSDWTAQTFTSEYTQDGLTVAATADQSVTIDGNKKTITGANNTYECTQRLKFGGAGGSGADGEYRYVKFDVMGDCTINIGLQSSSSGSDRILNVAKEECRNLSNIKFGTIYTSDTFYMEHKLLEEMSKRPVLGVEMETLALYTNAKVANKNAIAMFTVTDKLLRGISVPSSDRQTGLNQMIELALEIAIKLEKGKD